jgi:hypothetical protein
VFGGGEAEPPSCAAHANPALPPDSRVEAAAAAATTAPIPPGQTSRLYSRPHGNAQTLQSLQPFTTPALGQPRVQSVYQPDLRQLPSRSRLHSFMSTTRRHINTAASHQQRRSAQLGGCEPGSNSRSSEDWQSVPPSTVLVAGSGQQHAPVPPYATRQETSAVREETNSSLDASLDAPSTEITDATMELNAALYVKEAEATEAAEAAEAAAAMPSAAASSSMPSRSAADDRRPTTSHRAALLHQFLPRPRPLPPTSPYGTRQYLGSREYLAAEHRRLQVQQEQVRNQQQRQHQLESMPLPERFAASSAAQPLQPPSRRPNPWGPLAVECVIRPSDRSRHQTAPRELELVGAVERRAAHSQTASGQVMADQMHSMTSSTDFGLDSADFGRDLPASENE